jgi:hypothetical protein
LEMSNPLNKAPTCASNWPRTLSRRALDSFVKLQIPVDVQSNPCSPGEGPVLFGFFPSARPQDVPGADTMDSELGGGTVFEDLLFPQWTPSLTRGSSNPGLFRTPKQRLDL